MTVDDGEDFRIYLVVCNREGQYSIWLKHKAIPRGWQSVGKEGLRAECLRYIESVWTDMRPLSLRGLGGADIAREKSANNSG
jgi:MbtH protein